MTSRDDPGMALAAVFTLKAAQGCVLLAAPAISAVPDVSHETALRSMVLAAVCLGLVLLWRGPLAWLTCCAIAALSLVSNVLDPRPLVWAALSIAGSAAALALLATPGGRAWLRPRQLTINKE